MNYVRSNSLSLKNQMFTLSYCKDIGIRKFEFVAKTQFLKPNKWFYKCTHIVTHTGWNFLAVLNPIKCQV